MMSADELKIEKNVPMPPDGRGRNGRVPAFWRGMEIGDSFLVTSGKDIGPRISTWSKRSGFKFSRRVVEGGIRVWRVA